MVQTDNSGGYRICIFDLDGTLVDTMERYAIIAVESICIHHNDISPEEAKQMYMKTAGLPFATEIRKLFPGDPRNDRVIEEFKARHIDYINDVPFFPDVIPFIEYIRANGYMTAISSSTEHSLVEEYISAVAFDMFDCVLGAAEHMFKGKQHIGRIAEELDVARNKMLFVGDTLIDGELAAGSGVEFAARITTFKREDFGEIEHVALVDSLDELRRFFPPSSNTHTPA